MEVSILKSKQFYPFQHDYDIMPLEHKESACFSIKIHKDDEWLYRTSPTLILKPTNQNNTVYSIDPYSAARFIANSGFNKTGVLTALSPELIRANGMCFSILKWPKERRIPTQCSAQRIYKTKKDTGPKKALKSRLSKKQKINFLGPPKAMWECRSRYHTSDLPPTIPIKLKEFLDLPVCMPCFKKQYAIAPISWTPLTLYSTYFKPDFITEMIQPLSTKPLLPVLLGAVFASTMSIQFDPHKSMTDQLSTLYTIVIRFPEAFLTGVYEKTNINLLQLWTLVLGYEKHCILEKLIFDSRRLNYPAMLKALSPVLCTHSYANSNTITRVLNSKLIVTNLKRGTITRVAKTGTLLITSIPWTPFSHYTEYDNTGWIFSTDLISALYTLTMTKVQLRFKLVASYLENNDIIFKDSIHPNSILTYNYSKCNDVIIYPSELLGWHHINHLLQQKHLKTISFYGHYCTSRYGIQSIYDQFTHGACFADLLDICHMNLAKDTNKTPCTITNSHKELLDLTHASSVTCPLNNELESIECTYWKSGKIMSSHSDWTKNMTSAIDLIHNKEYHLHSYLKKHAIPEHTALSVCIPPALKRTLLHLRLLVI